MEESFAVNVLGNALLWRELEPFLLASSSEGSKVVVVSSELHRRCHRGELGLQKDSKAMGILPEDLEALLGRKAWKGMKAYKVGKLVQ